VKCFVLETDVSMVNGHLRQQVVILKRNISVTKEGMLLQWKCSENYSEYNTVLVLVQFN
jgi:hypothetical protein